MWSELSDDVQFNYSLEIKMISSVVTKLSVSILFTIQMCFISGSYIDMTNMFGLVGCTVN